MQRVGDWQLANPATNRVTGWIQSVSDVGIMALAGISGDPKYRDAMLAKGETNAWQLAEYQGRKYHADDQCYGQVCAELFLYRDNRMIAPLRAKFDTSSPIRPPTRASKTTSRRGRGATRCSWRRRRGCGFTRRPTTTRYLDFAVTNFWRTTDFLYDKDEHLFFRDSTFFKKTEANGKKIFWSRGNGWVLAGARPHAAIFADE